MCRQSESKFPCLTNIPSTDYPPGTILECEKCKTPIKLGAGGSYNLQQHMNSAACQVAASKATQKKAGTLLGVAPAIVDN